MGEQGVSLGLAEEKRAKEHRGINEQHSHRKAASTSVVMFLYITEVFVYYNKPVLDKEPPTLNTNKE